MQRIAGAPPGLPEPPALDAALLRRMQREIAEVNSLLSRLVSTDEGCKAMDDCNNAFSEERAGHVINGIEDLLVAAQSLETPALRLTMVTKGVAVLIEFDDVVKAVNKEQMVLREVRRLLQNVMVLIMVMTYGISDDALRRRGVPVIFRRHFGHRLDLLARLGTAKHNLFNSGARFSGRRRHRKRSPNTA